MPRCTTCNKYKLKTYFNKNRHRTCRECDHISNKKWHELNRAYHSEMEYWRKIKQVFGLSKEDYERMLAIQGSVCAICKQKDNRRLAVDHDHKTGRIRGLLCKRCNLTLGRFEDRPDLFLNAAIYLEE